MVSAHISPCYVVLPMKRYKWKLWAKMRGKVDSEEVESNLLKGGSIE